MGQARAPEHPLLPQCARVASRLVHPGTTALKAAARTVAFRLPDRAHLNKPGPGRQAKASGRCRGACDAARPKESARHAYA